MKKQILISMFVFLAAVLIVLATPVFNPISDQTINENETKTIDVVLSSTNGTTEFKFSQAPIWAAIEEIDDTHATITLSPGYDVVTGGNSSQDFEIIVTATDQDSSTNETFTVTVNNVNRNPTISGATIMIGYYDDSKEHTISASDPDGDAINYLLISAGDVNIASCTIAGNKLTATRKTNSSGTTTCTVQVSDGNGGTASADFTIEVKEMSKLKVDKIKIKGDADKETYYSDDIYSTMSINDVKPGGEFEVEIKLKNLYTDDEDVEIEDIEIEGTIFDVETDDDEEDIESDAEVDDLDADDSVTATLIFKIPLIVEADTYDMEIKITAEDENNNNFYITFDFDVEIKKESHETAIKDVSVSQTIVKAGKSISMEVTIVNIGKKDEDDAKIAVESDELGIHLSKTNIELESDIDDDDNKYVHTFTIDIPEDAEPGDYIFEINAYHDKDNLDDSETVTITVEQPAAAQPQEQVEVTTMTEQESQLLTQPTEADITETIEGESFTETNLFIGLLIAGIVAASILIILLLIIAFRRH